jgi:hypothetical protein
LIRWQMALEVQTDTGVEPLGTCWWEDGLQSTLRKRSASQDVIQMIEREMTDLREGRRECRAAPPPMPPVKFDARNPDHMAWLLRNINGREVTGGRLIVRVEYPGTWGEVKLIKQRIY